VALVAFLRSPILLGRFESVAVELVSVKAILEKKGSLLARSPLPRSKEGEAGQNTPLFLKVALTEESQMQEEGKVPGLFMPFYGPFPFFKGGGCFIKKRGGANREGG